MKCEYSIGVVRIDPSDSSDVAVVKNGMFTSTSYIAYRQGSLIPYLPVKGLAENTLFRDYIMDAIANEQSLGASNTFIEMANKWNERARGAENGIYKKQLIHLVRKYKNYRKIRSKEDAINNPDAIELLPFQLMVMWLLTSFFNHLVLIVQNKMSLEALLLKMVEP